MRATEVVAEAAVEGDVVRRAAAAHGAAPRLRAPCARSRHRQLHHRGRGGDDAPAPGRRPVAEQGAIARGQQRGDEVALLGEQFWRHRRSTRPRWMRCSLPERSARSIAERLDAGAASSCARLTMPVLLARDRANCVGLASVSGGNLDAVRACRHRRRPRCAGTTRTCNNSAAKRRPTAAAARRAAGASTRPASDSSRISSTTASARSSGSTRGASASRCSGVIAASSPWARSVAIQSGTTQLTRTPVSSRA